MVPGHGGAGRGRRGERNGAVVRHGLAVAGADGAVRVRDRHPVQLRGDLLPARGGVHRDLPVRLGPAAAVGSLVDAGPGGGDRRSRRDVGGGRELVDERSFRLHHGARPDHQREPGRGVLQRRDLLRGPAHDPGRVHGGRRPGRDAVRDRAAAGAPRPVHQARLPGAVHHRGDRHPVPDRRRGHGRPGHRQQPADQVRHDGVRTADHAGSDRMARRNLGQWPCPGRNSDPRPGLAAAGFSPHYRVVGWTSVPASQRPPLPTLIHLSFDVMVFIGTAMLCGASGSRCGGGGAVICPAGGLASCSWSAGRCQGSPRWWRWRPAGRDRGGAAAVGGVPRPADEPGRDYGGGSSRHAGRDPGYLRGADGGDVLDLVGDGTAVGRGGRWSERGGAAGPVRASGR